MAGFACGLEAQSCSALWVGVSGFEERLRLKIILTIAGSDCSGGAGVQADLKTITAFDCFGMSVITAVTAQNSQGVSLVHPLPVDVVRAQLTAILDDYSLSSIKIGMVGSVAVAGMLSEELGKLKGVPIVLDTPLMASAGGPLARPGVDGALLRQLFPLASLVTPNLDEAAHFLNGRPAETLDEMRQQAAQLIKDGAAAVLLKGGHIADAAALGEVVDLFFDQDGGRALSGPYVKMSHLHGTGCALASAIACLLGKGRTPLEAAIEAKKWLFDCISASGDMGFGAGAGPVQIKK